MSPQQSSQFLPGISGVQDETTNQVTLKPRKQANHGKSTSEALSLQRCVFLLPDLVQENKEMPQNHCSYKSVLLLRQQNIYWFSEDAVFRHVAVKQTAKSNFLSYIFAHACFFHATERLLVALQYKYNLIC